MKTVPMRALSATFARSFLIQGSWNYHTMLGAGFAFALLPALRRIFGDEPAALRASLQRHLELFNAHPYLSGVALGAVIRLEADGADAEAIRRFKTAVRGPLGGLGDSLVWAAWLPAVSLAALTLYWLGQPGWVAVTFFFVLYNVGHVGLRVWAFRVGLQDGREVARSLSRAALGTLTERIRVGAALALGLLAGAILGGDGGLLDSGALWIALTSAGFVGGVLIGHRLWRPAAAIVVITVGLLATWGSLS
jgi:PTS system mannose-specific IID component